MKKAFTKSLCFYMTIALIITIIAVYLMQMFITQSNHLQNSHDKLASVEEKLAQNDAQIAQLTETLGQNNLAKSRAFADLLAADKSILESGEKLNEIKDRLMVNELHVIDTKASSRTAQ